MTDKPSLDKNSPQYQARIDYAEIRKVLLLHWDPLGIHSFVGAQDEYDSYIFPIYRLLLSKATDEEVTEYLTHIERDNMGLRDQTKQDNIGDVVRLIRLAYTGN